MKRLLLSIMIIVAMLLMPGCALLDWITPGPGPVVESLSADVEIIDWEQDGDIVYIPYTITNIGIDSIDNYQIEFIALCADGSIFGDWTEMFEDGILPGDYEFSEFELAVGEGCEVINVQVGEWELIHWEF